MLEKKWTLKVIAGEDKIPNWCECELVVTGKIEDVKAFKEFAKDKSVVKVVGEVNEEILTENFIPYPTEVYEEIDLRKKIEKKEKLTKDEKNKAMLMKLEDNKPFDWYNWCCNNWGTKWGICYSKLREETYKQKGKLVYDCQTAWTPCLQVVVAMGTKFPALDFKYRYWEGGNGFQGTFVIKKGEIITNIQKEYRGGRGG